MLGGIIGAASGALGGVFGGVSKNNALKEQMRMLNEAKKDNQNWYDRRYNEDATQRADAQAMLTQTAEAIRQRNRQAAGSAAVMGGTNESVAAARQANATALAEATSQIATAGAARKDQIENQYLSKKEALDQQLRALQGQKVDTLGMISNGIGGAAQGFSAGMGLG